MKIEHMLLLLRQCLYGPLFLQVLFLVLHIDVNGRGSTAPSDVCANRPICASYKGL
jgi:hypothetical protein